MTYLRQNANSRRPLTSVTLLRRIAMFVPPAPLFTCCANVILGTNSTTIFSLLPVQSALRQLINLVILLSSVLENFSLERIFFCATPSPEKLLKSTAATWWSITLEKNAKP
jgi:hypothetical protein